MVVVALGADLHPDATPGLVEGGHEFYTVAGRVRAPRRAGELRRRPGHRRRDVHAVQVPAGAERDRAVDARLPHRPGAARQVRASRSSCRSRVPDPAVAGRVEGACSPRSPSVGSNGIRSGWCAASTRSRGVAVLSDGAEMPYDLFLGVPVHRAPAVVEASGTDRRRLDPGEPAHARDLVSRRLRGRRRHERRNPEGRRLRGGTGRGRRRRDRRADPRHPARRDYDGRGMCYLEFGDDQVARVDVTFLSGEAPVGDMEGPSSRSPRTRSSSAPAGSSAGSAAPGSRADRGTSPSSSPPRGNGGGPGPGRPAAPRGRAARVRRRGPSAAPRRGTARRSSGNRREQRVERERPLPCAPSGAPRQKWMPCPNARWRASARSMSSASGSRVAVVVAVRRREVDDHLRAGRDRDAAELDRLDRVAERRVRDRRVVAEELLDRGRDPAGSARRRASWSGCRSSATTPLPMRLVVVSCPATISWKIVDSSSLLVEALVAVARA